jgi:hypothetical protein
MTLDWFGFVLINVLVIGAYFIGKDAGVSEERHRADRRRAHRLRKESNQ